MSVITPWAVFTFTEFKGDMQESCGVQIQSKMLRNQLSDVLLLLQLYSLDLNHFCLNWFTFGA